MTLNLAKAGLSPTKVIHHNLNSAALVEHAVKRNEGRLSDGGALVTRTGQYTGRSPNDKFTVLDAGTEQTVWWGKEHRSITPDTFMRLRARVCAYLDGKELYVQDCCAGHNPNYRLSVRVVAERAWHSLFARNMFIPLDDELATFSADFTILHAPGFKAKPSVDGTNSEAAIFVDYTRKEVVICGTEYAGEIKKSIFTALNYLLPNEGVLGMHCSANIGDDGDASLFFGLSGTGKTTLSADPARQLIGDDEHGWCDDGIFNFEGGCYAKVIRLDEQAEPIIYNLTKRFGTILENVAICDETHKINLDDGTFAENTRASYALDKLENVADGGCGDHPRNIVFLTCDAFGVMPPIARLTREQALYHFMSGYTAKVAGTERGVNEPKAVFSACFGSPFMARHPAVYAELLGEKVDLHNVNCWLVNTGWTGGPYGIGNRMKIEWTRALLNSALEGKLENANFKTHPVFKIDMPTEVPGVPSDVLDPRETWVNKSDYDQSADRLAVLFSENFAQFEELTSKAICKAGPVSSTQNAPVLIQY
jgi:phosphoenolpyruvate carboxykinase (ATP)